MKLDFFGLIEFEIDWKAVAFLSLAPVFIKLVEKLG